MRHTHLRDAVLFSVLLVVCALFAHGQSFGPYTITSTGCTAPVDVSQKATATYQVLGSWSGTIQPKVSVAGQAPANTRATPVASSTAQSTITANGGYATNVAGYTTFLFCGNTVTNTAKIYINVSAAPR